MKQTNYLLLAFFLAPLLNADHHGPFNLTEMPYAYDALEPFIDELTMKIHHQRHQGGQVRGLNAQVSNFPELANMTIEEVMRNVSRFNTAVRNNGGGHFNHDLFWRTMAPQDQTGEPSPELLAAIDSAFGSMEDFKDAFSSAAGGLFGSGWAWLIVKEDHSLAVTTTPGQDNPLMDVVEERGIPILALDVWEHAYYLSYQNRRGAYVKLWWNVVNWEKVSSLFAQAVD